MIQEAALHENMRVATVERIARYTVGIGVEENRWMGTGTLISSGPDRYILTASHVIEGAQPNEMRFSCRPSAPIMEKAAKDVTDAEIGAWNFTMGYKFPISNVVEDRDADIALLKIDPAFGLPGAAEYYDIDKSREFKSWPVQALEGLSLFLYGFPVDNSRPL
jgi:S1-C subfamily serine protease